MKKQCRRFENEKFNHSPTGTRVTTTESYSTNNYGLIALLHPQLLAHENAKSIKIIA